MAGEWKLSCFTSVIPCDSGDLVLHNSFMGAVARVPAPQAERIKGYLQNGFKESDGNGRAIKELCEQGFFVSADLDERRVVRETLDQERSRRLGLMILPHENCNFRCIYCYEKFKRGKMGPDVVAGLKRFVDRNVGNYNGLGIAWFGGEPLLGYDVIAELSQSFIRSCRRHGVIYSSGMSTNAYLLTPDMFQLLLKHKVNNFQICIDGPEPIHNAKRKLAGGGGTYRRILDNLLQMRDTDEDFFVSLRVNFDNDSTEFIETWLEAEIAPRFAGDPRFGLHYEPVTRRGGPADAELDICEPKAAFPIRSGYYRKSLALGFSDRNVKKHLMPHGSVCYAAREAALIVGSDGAVYKCSLVFDDPRNAVGTLRSDGQLVVNQAKMSLWTTLEGRDTSACDSCPLYPCCQGRKCPLLTIKQNRPSCPMTVEMYETLVKLVAFGKAPDPAQAARPVAGE